MISAPEPQELLSGSEHDSAIRQARAERDVGTPSDSPDPSKATSRDPALIQLRAESAEHPWPVIPGIGRRSRSHRVPLGRAESAALATAERKAARAQRKLACRAKILMDRPAPEAGKGFAYMKEELLCDTRLGTTNVPIRLYGILVKLARGRGSTTAPLDQLADLLGSCSVRTVQRAQRRLEAASYIRIEPVRHGSQNDYNRYWIIGAERPEPEPPKPTKRRRRKVKRERVAAPDPAPAAPSAPPRSALARSLSNGSASIENLSRKLSPHESRFDSQTSTPSPLKGDSERRALDAPVAGSCGEPRLPDDMPITPIRATRLESCARAPPEQARAPPAKAATGERSAKTVPNSAPTGSRERER